MSIDMAMFGISINGQAVPDGVKRHFAERLKRSKVTGKLYSVGFNRGADFLLLGVATTPEERDQMLIQVNNGHREVIVIEKKTAGAPFYGIYA